MKGRKGITLIELLVVVVILGVLAAIAVPRLSQSATTAKYRTCQTNIDTINTQIELYYSNNDAWPADLATITDDPNYFPDEIPTCPTYGAYNLDSSTHRVSCTGH